LCVKKDLGPCFVKNSKAAITHGAAVTDAIASWIQKGFVAGPFCAPPTEKFRANSILAIPQPDKVRICINVSLPEGNSLNENIDKPKLEKIQMSSARLFGFSILEAGVNCDMWKFDFEDAYKNVPVPLNELRYQGFSWLGKYFIELKQMFGTITSVQNFDILGNTLKSLCQVSSSLPKRWIHRQLDDIPFVCKQNCQWGHEFASKYKKICKDIGIVLAPDCATFEKAFSCSKLGKVLGIFFNTETLSWRLPVEKAVKYKDMVFNFTTKQNATLKEMQNLMGCLNHVAQMCPFLLVFRFNLNKILARLSIPGSTVEPITQEAIQELFVWFNFLNDNDNWFPICPPVCDPPLCTKTFASDAAGFPKHGTWSGKIGCASIGLNEQNDTFFAHQLWWPKDFICSKTDGKGTRFGDKTATLEEIGILIPLLTIPEKLVNQHVIFKTDNLACVYGHANKYMKGDSCASILIKAVHLISARLGSIFHVTHVKRRSDWESEMVDNMSRESTTGFLEKRILQRQTSHALPPIFLRWLDNPTEDWDLPNLLLDHVSSRLEQ
jgi:hypothetical protein